MTSSQLYESLITEICVLERETLIERLCHFDGDLRLDFPQTYLATCATEYLRHLLLAAEWRCRMKAASSLDARQPACA